MKINHNISALVANGHLSRTNNALDKSLERLSSGYRINHAADDSAGMAISQKMKTQIRGLEQASRNASDGISVIQTAEGALGEIEAMLQRARELAVQAANGTNTGEDREAIQKEVAQLKNEIQRISDDTEFNKKSLLNGDLDRKSYSNNIYVNLVSLSDEVESLAYDITVDKEAVNASFEGNAAPTIGAAGAQNEGTVIINGEEISIKKGQSLESIKTDILNACDRAGILCEGGAAPDPFTFTANEAGSHRKVEIACTNPALATELGIATGTATPGEDAEISLNGGFGTTAVTTAKGNLVTIKDQSGFEMKLEILPGAMGQAAGAAKVTVLDAGPMTLQIGANEGQDVDISIPETSPKTLGIENLNLMTQDGASEGLTMIDEAIEITSGIRAKLGAYQNRMEHAIANLDVASQNLTEALSRIEDADMAEEMATFTQQNVLAQAGVSMLAQANERPQQVLSLLQ